MFNYERRDSWSQTPHLLPSPHIYACLKLTLKQPLIPDQPLEKPTACTHREVSVSEPIVVIYSQVSLTLSLPVAGITVSERHSGNSSMRASQLVANVTVSKPHSCNSSMSEPL